MQYHADGICKRNAAYAVLIYTARLTAPGDLIPHDHDVDVYARDVDIAKLLDNRDLLPPDLLLMRCVYEECGWAGVKLLDLNSRGFLDVFEFNYRATRWLDPFHVFGPTAAEGNPFLADTPPRAARMGPSEVMIPHHIGKHLQIYFPESTFQSGAMVFRPFALEYDATWVFDASQATAVPAAQLVYNDAAITGCLKKAKCDVSISDAGIRRRCAAGTPVCMGHGSIKGDLGLSLGESSE